MNLFKKIGEAKEHDEAGVQAKDSVSEKTSARELTMEEMLLVSGGSRSSGGHGGGYNS